MNNQLVKGTIIGLIAPVAAFVVYIAFFTDNPDPIGVYRQLVQMDLLSHAMSLSVLINLVIFFMNIKTRRDQEARGVLLATILYGITIAIIRFS
tara:strand:- start:259 stop:540 length:282 start_codon:yes stop_codon:yes gene_type:complete